MKLYLLENEAKAAMKQHDRQQQAKNCRKANYYYLFYLFLKRDLISISLEPNRAWINFLASLLHKLVRFNEVATSEC